MRDSLAEIHTWTLVQAAIMHEFLDQIEEGEEAARLEAELRRVRP